MIGFYFQDKYFSSQHILTLWKKYKGKYTLGKKIGSGYESKCFVGKLEDEKYCLKLIRIDSKDEKKMIEIKREIEVLSKLKGSSLASLLFLHLFFYH